MSTDTSQQTPQQASCGILVLTARNPHIVSEALDSAGYGQTHRFHETPPADAPPHKIASALANIAVLHDGIVALDVLMHDVHALMVHDLMPPEWKGRIVALGHGVHTGTLPFPVIPVPV